MPAREHPTFDLDTARLDQHFLDTESAARIVTTAQLHPTDVVLEIGAGTGILTSAILDASPRRLVAVEVDDRCRPYLNTLQPSHPELAVLIGRIQDIGLPTLASTTMIIANPPFSALEYITRLVRGLPLLREVTMSVSQRWAATITAPIGAPIYATPSVAFQSRFIVKIIESIAGDRFTPAISTPAALLQLLPRRTADPILDVLADALLHQRGMRVKDLLRSHRLKQTFDPGQHRALLRRRDVRELQQQRLNELNTGQISQIATALRSVTECGDQGESPVKRRIR